MTSSIKLPLVTVALLTLGGCAVNPADCDPTNRDASIIAKTRCTTSGAYQVRVDEKQKILLDEQRMNVLFRDVYNAVEKEKGEVRSELQNKRSDYSALKRSLNALLGELKTKAKGNQQIEGEIAALEKDLANIQTQDSPVVVQKQAQLDELRNRVVELEQGLGLRE